MKTTKSIWLEKDQNGEYIFKIGKHKGKPISLVDDSYINWILNTVGPEGEDRDILINTIKGTRTKRTPYMEEQDDDMGREAGMEYYDQPLNDDILF